MAISIFSPPLWYLFFSSSLLLLSLLCALNKGYAFEGRKMAETEDLYHHSYHTVLVSSLLPSSVCSPSTKALDKTSSLKVVHKHGPCYQLKKDKANGSPSHTEILLQDQSRVHSIHSKLSNSHAKPTDSATVPATSGSSVGTGNYVVTVGFGTPKKELPLVFDTGSDLTWTQCEPCVKYCYQQTQPIFDPTASASYANISCSSATCNSLMPGTGNSPGCSSSTCVYGIQYGDSSYSIGFFASETLTLTPKDKIHNFLFGCGQNNRGLFGLSAGLLGLGRDGISLVSQTAKKYNKLFSYCLPSSSSSIGYLTFGPTASSQSVKYTPFSTISGGGTSYYWVDITGIRVGGKKLSILASVFTNSGTIIDSGTVITRLPPDAYSPLRDTFKKRMKQYRTAPPLSILDTCYDLSKYSSVSVPKISFLFSGGVEVPLDIRGILYVNTISQVCLAFAGNREANDAAIFGNTQQLTLEVLYDGTRRRVGFATGGCS